MIHTWLRTLLAASLLVSIGCGDDGGGGDNGGADTADADPNAADADPNAPDADPNAPDADPNAPDAAGGGLECSAQGAQCNNCIDDDGDGFIDGQDVECTGINDDDEGSFATDIPGDNIDGTKQDCFFDGDSGAGNDGCDLHVCCFLEPFVDCCEAGQTNAQDGCLEFTGPAFDPLQCTPSQTCVDNCQPLTPPGCDCFGCCTICVDGVCNDILTNPGVYQNETCEGITDPVQGECCEAETQAGCFSCTKSDDCNPGNCNDDPNDCILCPGQTEADLPDSCNAAECPADTFGPCQLTEECGTNQFCSNGCCVSSIIID